MRERIAGCDWERAGEGSEGGREEGKEEGRGGEGGTKRRHTSFRLPQTYTIMKVRE